ncbi:CHASE domain-containing protein [Alteromonas gilva]|uniref:histidine kinase n=1 Tax=Alteromonas gilva TaxID=2987522 RepID=A0ABT5L155_9ALTE|nr:CHASE domain-containing protein [Alteromonas gilva]MDC8830755.1 CHASE domain-containing protein [Alteromonas gilva]
MTHKSSLTSSLFRNRYTKLIWLPLLTIVIGYFFAAQHSAGFLKARDTQIAETLDNRLQQITEAVRERVGRYTFGLLSLRGAISAFDINNLQHANMNAYAVSQNYAVNYPGARGFGFIRRVEADDLAEFLTRARDDRPDGQFELRSLSRHNNSKFIIQYIMPESANLQAIGLDIGSEAMRRRSAVAAATTNSIQLTAPITLVQANKKPLQGFLILQPVYNSLAVPDSPEERMAALVGWTYAPLLIDEILSSVSGLRNDVSITIVDNTAAEPITFFDRRDESVLADLQTNQNLQLFGRNWQIQLTPKQAFIDNLRLPDKNQAFSNAMAVVVSLALIILSLQLLWSRRAENKRYEQELALANQRALELNNERLENEVAARTHEIAQANILQRSILEGAGYALIATDTDGIISVFNPAAERLLGYSASEVVGKTTPAPFHLRAEVEAEAKALTEELGVEVTPGFEVFVARVKDGQTITNDWTYVRKDGSHVPVRLSVTSLLDDSCVQFGYLGIAFDLSAQLRRERELSDARIQAEKANEAKSSFLANMSHEIRTPLNGIYGTLQLLRKVVSNEQDRNLLDNATSATRNLSRIINDILDFSKIEAGKISIEAHPFVLSEMLETLQADLAMMLAEKQVSLSVINEASVDHWVGDAVRLRQVLLNIGTNAIKFTEQGSVTIVVTQPTESELCFAVKDTGVGMSGSALQRLFQRFEQADSSTTRKYGGTGLGLSITQSLVELMGGKIHVQSQLEQGSEFTITLPMEPAQQGVNEPDAANDTTDNHASCDLGGRTVLVAEDNDINRLVLEAMLEETNSKVFFVVNGKEAVEFAGSKRPDIILMDIQMPEMDGIEACKRIKQFDQHALIIAVTANAMTHDIELYNQVGFDDYLSKPIDIKLLYDLLNRHVASH